MDTPLVEKVDILRTKQQARIAAQKILDQQQLEEKALMEEIRLELIDKGMTGVAGTIGSVSLSRRINPEVEDWGEFFQFMVDAGNMQLLQKRPSVSAIREIWEIGDDVPGVVRVEEDVLILGKA